MSLGMVYLHGEGDIFPRLEKALEGHFAGEGFTIHLEPEEAFGEYDADAIRCIPVENFAHPERLEVGELVDEVPGEAPDGRSWRVTDMADGMAVLEANHPLSGVGLQFAVKVLDVHEPSEAELESMEDDGSASLVPPFLRLADKIVSEEDELHRSMNLLPAALSSIQAFRLPLPNAKTQIGRAHV